MYAIYWRYMINKTTYNVQIQLKKTHISYKLV